ncbi:hypothetical protein TcasGA2_TC009702 [Tribolium castaneum]|uniref:TNFR-Cys domain-containing protein n=1 Tax=Tribolium castaneum TaxID=7070 RepID=D6WU50_TRICA|nr:PREDICTED: uncharacterized protein LOC103313602 [Tribolium castaneum]EFA06768.1 hypothetical protein TcasGA2_TC009702 [Tribolium castaneum]|eukprot:XP_008195499.1 PREDICTED: uncharacterized protein LOC103313602 [Tribolium castaneum]
MKPCVVFFLLLSFVCLLEAVPHKRETFCRDNRCLTCIGRYCTTTCEGEDCKKCPLGDCCDGSKCNICRGARCCETSECNNCVNECLKKCIGKATCHYDCFQECLPNGGGSQQENKTYYGSPLVNNHNYFPVNVTTIINITNSLYNDNAIYNPIFVNTTNVNNYTGDQKTYHHKQVILGGGNNEKPEGKPVLLDLPEETNSTQNCCEVVHPENCQTVPRESSRLCFTGKHNECSQICIGKHVHIVEDKEQSHQCVSIAHKPYFFCGNYVVENCDGCYECKNAEDENEVKCDEQESCPEKCKSSMIDEQFYNRLYRKD